MLHNVSNTFDVVSIVGYCHFRARVVKDAMAGQKVFVGEAKI